MADFAILRSMGGLVFDATFSEEHTSEMSVTDNPVETGVVVSDHAFMNPQKVTIRAGVSDTPLKQRADDPFASSSSRSKRAFELLKALQKTREPFSLQTGLELYQNMVCLSVRAPQDKNSARALFFTADLREVQIVNTQTVTYPTRASGATSRQAGATKEKGEQQGKQVTDTAKKQSIAKRLSNALGVQ